MRVVHFAPFAPAAAGIYEAARDMCRADHERGHDVVFVDVGKMTLDGVRQEPVVGQVDSRAGYALVAQPPAWGDHADLIVLHTGVADGWIVRSQAPIVVIMHGRPAAAFRFEERHPEQMSYRLYREFSTWPRVRAMVTFWPEHEAYWKWVVGDKLRLVDGPPLDTSLYVPEGPAHPLASPGEWNLLICDSGREDIDTFEVANGALEAARRLPGVKVHFWAIETQPGTALVWPRWDLLFGELRHLGAMGELHGREGGIERVYRAMDMVLSPQRIATRTIIEPQACGCPVIADRRNRATPYRADVFAPGEVADKVIDLVAELKREREAVRAAAVRRAQQFGLARYGERMERIYQEAVR